MSYVLDVFEKYGGGASMLVRGMGREALYVCSFVMRRGRRRERGWLVRYRQKEGRKEGRKEGKVDDLSTYICILNL